jgi:hypothetical protein
MGPCHLFLQVIYALVLLLSGLGLAILVLSLSELAFEVRDHRLFANSVGQRTVDLIS